MAYRFFLGNTLCPVAPSKLEIKVNGQNKTMTLINEGEINILKKAGLTEISFDLLLPNVKYPFATYKSGFKNAKYFLDKLENYKKNKKVFQFIVTRKFPDGKMLFDTNMKVSLEDYTIKEDSGEGFDVIVSVKLKQFKEYGTKKCDITFAKTKPKIKKKKKTRAKTTSTSANTPPPIGIGSTVLVNGQLHRDSYGNGAGQWRTNYIGKINFINAAGSHPYHVTDPSGGWLGWVLASAVQGV